MKIIANLFAETFAHWGIRLPDADLRERRAGYITEAGWLIQYCFGQDDTGEFLDFYASHRMTDDRHTRLYSDGRTQDLPGLVGFRVGSEDPVEDKRLELEYRRQNREIADMLCAKGFDRFTINMALHAGLDGSDGDA